MELMTWKHLKNKYHKEHLNFKIVNGYILRDTLNPNFSGNSFINLFIIVDFPHPLGPETTIDLD